MTDGEEARMGAADKWMRGDEGLNPYVEVDMKKKRGDDGETEEEEEEWMPPLCGGASSEESMGYFVEDVSSSDESAGEAQHERMARMKKRMDIMLTGVNCSLNEKRGAARRETELDECRRNMYGGEEQVGALEAESEE